MSDRPLEQRHPPDQFPCFQPPICLGRFRDVMYAVSGQTRVENHLITPARDTLLSYLRADARVAACLQEWGASIGLLAIEHDIADFLDRVARQFGLARRRDLVRHRRTPDTPIEDLLPEWYRLQARLYAAYDRVREVTDVAETYVCDELRLPWPWLAFRLTFDLFDQAHERALGVTFVHRQVSYLDDHVYGPWVPHVPFPDREPRDERTLAEALQQFSDAAREYRNTLRAMARALPGDVPKGTLLKDQEGIVRRNVRWLYEKRVCRKPMYQLAKAHHAERLAQKDPKHTQKFPECSCYQNVKDGIKDADRLLGMSPYIFTPS